MYIYMQSSLTQKQKFKIENLCCANCGAKIEAAVKKLDGVTDASLNFIMQKLTIEADDGCFNKVVEEAAKVCKKIEPECVLVIKQGDFS